MRSEMSGLAVRVHDVQKVYRRGVRSHSLRAFLGAFLRGESRPMAGGSFQALAGVSFEVRPGEVFGIIGRNGAGKSTLLKILTRITTPSGGYVETWGRVGSLLEVGTGFHPELTGRENIFLNGAILGMTQAEVRRRFDEILAFAGVEQHIDTPVKHYSSGMYTRLAFAVAAHLETEVLLVDEVLAVGDHAFQRKCLGRMGELSQAGRTVLLVSHQLNAIRQLCQRAVWLDGGRVRQLGPTGGVIAAYEADAMAEPEVERDHGRFIRRWELDGGRHEVSGTLSPVELHLHLFSPAAIPHGALSVYLNDDGQTRVWGWDSSLPPLEAGRHRLSIRLGALPVRPGLYYWRATLFSDRVQLEDWHGVPPLVVSAEQVSHSRDQWMGLLNVSGELSVSSLGEDE